MDGPLLRRRKWSHRRQAHGEGQRVATVGVDDTSWGLNYVYTGDQVGWNLAGRARRLWQAGQLLVGLVTAGASLRRCFLAHGQVVRHTEPGYRGATQVPRLPRFLQGGVVLRGRCPLVPAARLPPHQDLLMGFGIGEKVEKTSNLPMWVLMVLAGLAGGLVLGLNVEARVIDVGYAGVVGADSILGHHPTAQCPKTWEQGTPTAPQLPAVCTLRPHVRLLRRVGFPSRGPRSRCSLSSRGLWHCSSRATDSLARRVLQPSSSPGLPSPTHLRDQQQHQRHIVAAVSAIGLAAAASPIARGRASRPASPSSSIRSFWDPCG